MASGENWSQLEVEACVADYLHMLTLELNGQRYSKTEHARALLQKLQDRNRPSLEFKHCNISAVLVKLGYPCISGYKPRGNFQALLQEVVELQTQANAALQAAAEAASCRPAMPTSVDFGTDPWVSPPAATAQPAPRAEAPAEFRASQRDYLALESRNRSLGHAGELLVMELETRRLHAAGKKKLAERVEHVAHSQGDGLGYDVLSFEETGRERLIEVKTTAFGRLTPFYVSRNELARSRVDAAQYQLYRLFDFRHKPRLFALSGAIDAHSRLQPVSYRAQPGAL
jgi:hypothetical protein